MSVPPAWCAADVRRRPLLPGGADAALWELADEGTRRLAAETVETLRIREIVVDLAARYANVGLAIRAGHLFEVMHASSFNRDAIAQGASVRAAVTEWMAGGSQTAAADIQLLDGGRLVAEAQAKLVDRTTALASGVARSSYDGMQRLVAGDKLQAVSGLLDRRLTLNREGLRYADYQDARAHLTDRLHAADVRSQPLTSDAVHRAAERPIGWANAQVAGAVGHQVLTAAGVGAAGGAAVAGVLSAARSAAKVRAGETSASTAAATAAAATARGAVRGGTIAALGEAVRVAAQADLLPDALGGGTLPLALARAVYGVAEAGVAFARGDIDAGQFAARSCESTLTVGLVWACGSAGQTVIPVPVVGALVGGLVGQFSATVIVQGTQFALAAVREDQLPEERIAVLEAETAAAVFTASALGDAVEALGAERNAFVATTVLPQVAGALESLAGAGTDDALHQLAAVTRQFAGQPVFCTMAEFDAWMRDPFATLTLDPNWH
ncbi:hypothetical protein [Blastococcus sp. PRF04-17]|uniref:hypothetical protein n=1 Tax=Blastococcus sp. PRF04-17 TaxID=2933797 RepID=UPI001FF4B281|nr:hypothetical protein [Blastococcus sp. PRF04-17]UOY03723.1 hypothetical protein MVA48_10490 [Blastococcus sp. PRF04-17]